MSGPQYPGPSYPAGNPPPNPDLSKRGPAGPPPGPYPPPPGNYAPSQDNYPPQGAYPPPQGSYPPQGAYPPPQGNYPPPPSSSPYGQQPYGQQPATGGGADIGIRFVARIIDWIVVGVPVYIVNTVLFWTAPWFLALIVSFVLSFAAFVYFVYFETQQEGSTVGKKLLKLKVLGPQGGVPTMEESAKRNIWMLVGVLTWLPIFFLGFILAFAWIGLMIFIAITVNSDPRNQGWHDKFAGGTTVVKTG
jgi:uncharacterized RDD family membrane protein YckC